MREHEAVRRLVKSAPELWAVCSDASMLAKHLDSFGEITITRLEPESTVAWEGETASGTVFIEPAGWGTKVTVRAQIPGAGESSEAEPEPPAVSAPSAVGRGLVGLIAGFLRSRRLPVLAPTVAVEEQPAPPAIESPDAEAPEDLSATLEAVLESLGQAHHRPYSRA